LALVFKVRQLILFDFAAILRDKQTKLGDHFIEDLRV
jgi:hypothetical protein